MEVQSMDINNDNLLDVVADKEQSIDVKQLALLMMIRNNLVSIKHWVAFFGIIMILYLIFSIFGLLLP